MAWVSHAARSHFNDSIPVRVTIVARRCACSQGYAAILAQHAQHFGAPSCRSLRGAPHLLFEGQQMRRGVADNWIIDAGVIWRLRHLLLLVLHDLEALKGAVRVHDPTAALQEVVDVV